jgi:hypothetical protein
MPHYCAENGHHSYLVRTQRDVTEEEEIVKILFEEFRSENVKSGEN